MLFSSNLVIQIYLRNCANQSMPHRVRLLAPYSGAICAVSYIKAPWPIYTQSMQ
jgi:hypothetical protein